MKKIILMIVIVFSSTLIQAQSEIMRKTSDNANEAIFINMDEFMRGVSTSLVVKENKEIAIYYRGSSLRIGSTFYSYQKLYFDSLNNLVMAVTEEDSDNMVMYGLYDNTLLVMLVKITEDNHVIIDSYGFFEGKLYFDKLKKLSEKKR